MSRGNWFAVVLIIIMAAFYGAGCGNPDDHMMTTFGNTTVHSAQWYVERGLALYQEGSYEEAIEQYNLAIKRNSNYSTAYNNRAVAYNALGEKEKALADYTKAIEYNPNDDVSLYLNRGILRHDLGEYPKAIADYNMVIALDPHNVNAYYNRAMCYQALGDYGRAIIEFTMTIDISPDNIEAYYLRGNCYAVKAKYIEALSDYHKVKEIDQNYAAVQQNYDNTCYNALEMYNAAIDSNTGEARNYYERGQVYALCGQTMEAIADFQKCISLSDDPDLIMMAEKSIQQINQKW